MEAGFGRLHISGGPPSGPPTVVDSIMVDGEINGSEKLMKHF